MKITVKETFEQGLPRKQGGVVKLVPGTYEATQANGLTTLAAGGKSRAIPTEIVDRWVSLGLVALG